jgi:enoyl-CoA hydratase/carnithine racemase
MAVHAACVGGATNMICFGDIRYCTKDAWFQVKETALGKSGLDLHCDNIGDRTLAYKLGEMAAFWSLYVWVDLLVS